MAKDKATKQAEKAEKQQLKSAQKAEVKALKSVGATKSEVKAEQKANSVELKSLIRAQKSGTYTPRTDLAAVLSNADTYANAAYAPEIQSLLGSAAQNYTDYNIATVNKRGNVTTGVGLDKLVDYQLGKTGDKFDALMDRAKTYVGNTYTLADLAAQGVNLKQDKQNPGLFKWSTGGDGNKEITYFTQNPDGTYTGAGINRVRTEKEDGGFFDSPWGKIALGIGGFYLGPLVGSAMGLGSGVAAGTVGGALVGGTASKLGGGQFLPGAVSGGMGGFGGAGGISKIPGVSDFTSNLPGVSDIPGVGEAIDWTKTQLRDLGVPGFQEQLGGGLKAPGMDIGSISDLGGLGAQAPNIGLNVATEPIYSVTQLGDTLGAIAPSVGPGMSLGQGITTNIAAGGGGALSDAAMKALFPAAMGVATGAGIAGLLSQIPGLANISGLGAYALSNLAGQALQQPLLAEAGGGGYAGADPNYNALIAALSAPRAQPRSLV